MSSGKEDKLTNGDRHGWMHYPVEGTTNPKLALAVEFVAFVSGIKTARAAALSRAERATVLRAMLVLTLTVV